MTLRAFFAYALFVVAIVAAPVGVARAQIAGMPPELAHVGVAEHPDGQLPLATSFVHHTGQPVTPGPFHHGTAPARLDFP